MTSAAERLQVLKMVEAGQISAAEAIEILDLLATAVEMPAQLPPLAGRAPTRMRVAVTDLVSGERKVDVTLPWNLATVGMSMGARFTPSDIDLNLDDVLRAVELGAEGKVLEVVDEAEGERVEIFVD